MARGETPEGINALTWPPKEWKMQETKQLLEERGKTHGHIEDNAFFTEEFVKLASQQTPPKGVIIWYEMHQTARFCLWMIFHKIGRILSGNWREPDHWRDIAGYATLVADRLERGELQ